jgi:uncharacterized protein YidB (DUF937 family)
MGLLDQVQSMMGGSGVSAEQHATVTKELVGAIGDHPGGVGGLLDQLRQCGLGSHVDQVVHSEPGTQAPALSPEQVQNNVPSGLLGQISARTGLPPQVVTMALTTALPLVLQHMTPGGQVPAQGQTGGLAQQLLSKLL